MSRKEQALSVDEPIEIISSEIAQLGIFYLQYLFDNTFPDPNSVSLVPVRRGGDEIGAMLSRPAHRRYFKRNPIRVSLYDEFNNPFDRPQVLADPDLSQILHPQSHTTRDVAFAEAVVDSQATILASQSRIHRLIGHENMLQIDKYPFPVFHTFALISKSQPPIEFPNLHAAFQVPSDIWVFGRGCDSRGGKGRKYRSIMGTLSPHAAVVPERPFATLTPEMALWLSTIMKNIDPLLNLMT